MTKEVGKRQMVREQKEALRSEIRDIREKIGAALTASRVPERVVNGDVLVAQKWKDAMELGENAAYHIKHNPSPVLTVEKLMAIRDRLNGCLNVLQ